MNEHQHFRSRLARLIAAPSVSSAHSDWDMSNLDVLNALREWLEPLGFRCEVQEVEPNKGNLIAVLGEGRGGLVLSGHADTVPYDESRWSSDPFKLDERDSRLYGLGTCDMKGFFPIVLAAIERLALKKEALKHPLIVLATADEESSMNGARALVREQVLDARYAIIGEPTSLTPIRMHKGIGMERLSLRGQAGHSSNPALGNNAIEAMHEVISHMLVFRSKLQARYQNPGFEVQVPTMNLGCIHGGDNPNRICGHCALDFDIRSLPGMPLDDLRAELLAELRPIADARGIALDLQPLFPGVEAFEQDQNSELVRMVERLCQRPAESVAFATEAAFMQKLGMQTIVLGAGSIDQAHQPDEFLSLDQIEPAIQIIQSAIQECCL